MNVFSIVYVVTLIISIVIHEVAHGYAADRLGDSTARYAGRLTLNPIPHIDLMGSIIVPGILLLTGSGLLFGWAKPVPFNLANIPHDKRRFAPTIIALAGPVSNLILAVLFGLLVRFADPIGLGAGTIQVFVAITLTNLVLALFNLMPVPPLDGHHILFDILGERYPQIRYQMQRYAMVWLFIGIFVLWRFVQPLVSWLFMLITGLGL